MYAVKQLQQHYYFCIENKKLVKILKSAVKQC